MSKSKPASSVPGVYYREDGQPRWEVRVRWVSKGQKRHLPTVRFPVDSKAVKGEVGHLARARADAEAYATRERQAIETHGKPHSMRSDAWTLRALLERYLDDLEKGRIHHKANKTERSTIRMLLGKGKGHNAAGFAHLMDKWIADLEYGDFVGDNEKSLQLLLKDRDGNKAGTGALKRVLTVVRCVFVRAKENWKIELENPLQTIRGLTVDDARERVITGTEWEKITNELRHHEQGTQDAIIFARFTAARRSEVVKLDWADIDFVQKTARLRETKSRSNKTVERVIPLPAAALEIVVRRAQPSQAKQAVPAEELARHAIGGPVFTSNKGTRLRPDTLTQAWTRACGRAEVYGARVHDLRHTRITELGRFLTAAEAARVSGHTDLATFFRYFNPDPVETGKKIDAMERGQNTSGAGIREAANALASLSNEDFGVAIIAAIEARSKSVAGR
jgi:integrase